MTTRALRLAGCVAALTLLASAAVHAAPPVTVSPGGPQYQKAGSRCPTFTWGVADAHALRILVYQEPEDEASQAPLVIDQELAGTATAWTPPLDSCLTPGLRYAWVVGAVDEGGAVQWSAPSWFGVPGADELIPDGLVETLAERLILAGQRGRETGALESRGHEAEPAGMLPAPPERPRKLAATTPFSVASDGSVAASSFAGDGAGITGLDPASLSAGTAAISVTGTASNVTGTVVVANGGTGATTAAAARTSLGAAADSHTHGGGDVTSAVAQAIDADQLDGEHAAAFWNLAGNAGASPSTSFLGTTDAQALVLRTNDAERLRVDAAGLVGVGTDTPTERLTVRGDAVVLGEDAPEGRGFTSTNLDLPRSVYVAGRYAYVASWSNASLAIFDVSDPDTIVAKGSTTTNLNQPISVFVAGRYAYVASYENDRLAIFDVSDPGAIVAKGFTSTNLSSPTSVYVAGRYAYVASYWNSSLAIFDVSDPDTIVAKGSTTTNLGAPYSVYVAGRYAYVASYGNSSLAIFDVSDPDTIVAMGSTTTNLSGPVSVYVAGRYAYVASSVNGGLTIFDVSDPDTIVAKGSTTTNLSDPYSVYVAGRYAYVASMSNSRLAIFDVSDPDAIVARGFTSTNLSYPRSVYVAGRHAYVASGNNDRLAIFDLNDLDAPTVETGALFTGSLQVGDNAIVNNDLSVQGALIVGPGGAQVGGDLGVEGKLFAHTSVTALTGSGTLAPAQSGVVLVNNGAAATVTLPAAASSKGVTFTVKRLTASGVSVATAAGTIDGAATQSLAAQYDFISVISDGTSWHIVGR